MITEFKIFENENPPNIEAKKVVDDDEITQLYSEDYGVIYKYRNIDFGWWGNGFRLAVEINIWAETDKMTNYIDEYINNGDPYVVDKEGYTSPEHKIGKTLDELKKSIDDYYIYKEAEKYNM